MIFEVNTIDFNPDDWKTLWPKNSIESGNDIYCNEVHPKKDAEPSDKTDVGK